MPEKVGGRRIPLWRTAIEQEQKAYKERLRNPPKYSTIVPISEQHDHPILLRDRPWLKPPPKDTSDVRAMLGYGYIQYLYLYTAPYSTQTRPSDAIKNQQFFVQQSKPRVRHEKYKKPDEKAQQEFKRDFGKPKNLAYFERLSKPVKVFPKHVEEPRKAVWLRDLPPVKNLQYITMLSTPLRLKKKYMSPEEAKLKGISAMPE